MHLSVVIPTHNPDPARLARVLQGLAEQRDVAFAWEVIVVDNASEPPVTLPETGARPPRCRLVREPQLGLTYARETGMREARGELWLSVDDDNVLAPDYLAVAAAFMAEHPEVGALGGRIVPVLEQAAPAWLVQPEHGWRLALRDFGAAPLISRVRSQPLEIYPYFAPIGAGMVLRRAGLERYWQWRENTRQRFSDRRGDHLGTCGDSELVMQTTLLAHQEVAYCPALSLEHLIPASRLRYRYLMRLAYQGSQTWAEFKCRYGLDQPVGRARALLRCARAFFFVSAWHPAGFINWCEACGYQMGLSRAP